MPSLSIVELVVFGLATWRLVSLLTWERGPWHIFQGIRTLAGIKHNEHGHPVAWKDGFFRELLTCVWCASLWVGAFWAATYAVLGGPAIVLALPFALSAVALVFGKYVK